MSTITINGRTVEVPDGSSISVVNNAIYINGSPCPCDGELAKLSGIVTLKIQGSLLKLDVKQGDVEVYGNVEGAIDCAGSVAVDGFVHGNVNAGGSVQCGDVSGDIDAGGSVKCGKVGGKVDAGGSVMHG